jgi:predicted nuclease of predicted toxin-antitoxin system
VRIKLDENLSRHLKAALADEGHEASTAADEGLLGRDDVEVGAAAKLGGMMLFTLDLEFADLRKHAPADHPGVVLFRPRSLGPGTVNRFVLDFVRATDLADLAGCVAVVDPGRTRVRRPPSDEKAAEVRRGT